MPREKRPAFAMPRLCQILKPRRKAKSIKVVKPPLLERRQNSESRRISHREHRGHREFFSFPLVLELGSSPLSPIPYPLFRPRPSSSNLDIGYWCWILDILLNSRPRPPSRPPNSKLKTQNFSPISYPLSPIPSPESEAEA